MQTKANVFKRKTEDKKKNKGQASRIPPRAVGCAMTISQGKIKAHNVHTDRQQQVTMMTTATQANVIATHTQMLGPCNLFLISKHCRDKIKRRKGTQ
jgi:hypothetical protein